MGKVRDIIIAIIFIWFCYVQLNDTDSYYWILLYLPMVIIALCNSFYKVHRLVIVAYILFILISIAPLVPSLIDWTNEGFPSIFDDVLPTKDEKIREVLGGLVTLLFAFYYFFTTNNN